MKDYQSALRYYERAMSCYLWLEVLDEDEVEMIKRKKKQQITISEIINDQFISESNP